MSCVEQFEVSCVLLFWGFEESSDDQRIRADLSGSHHVAVDNSSFTCLHRWLSESWKKQKEHWIWVIKDSWLSANKHGSFNYLVNTFVLNDESHFSIWKHPVLPPHLCFFLCFRVSLLLTVEMFKVLFFMWKKNKKSSLYIYLEPKPNLFRGIF